VLGCWLLAWRFRGARQRRIRDSSIWFCGPLKFGDALEKSFVSMGLPKGQFHREAFDFR
jgi:predicted ferric reductase